MRRSVDNHRIATPKSIIGLSYSSPTFGKVGPISFVEDPRSSTFGQAGRDSFVEDPRSPTFGKAGRDSFIEDPRSPTFEKAGRDSLKIHDCPKNRMIEAEGPSN
ncbi:hypothetical protein V8G54_023952 [Vigna mungo]|uniref:Uncharacterized protein n=1 Tax=Vigna mungo TaxID=3915 RepID=A0AAQ3N5X3_VIGMU